MTTLHADASAPTVLRPIAGLVIAGLALAGCQGDVFPPVDVEPPAPTMLERSMLGTDADVPYFLEKFRSCAAYASYGYCRGEMYGGGEI